MTKKSILALLILAFFMARPMAAAAQQDQTDPIRLEREKRISERISQRDTKLSEEQKRHYKAKCQAAQTKLREHQEQAKEYSEQNDKKIDELLNKIAGLLNNLKENGRDTSQPDATFKKALDYKAELDKTKNNYLTSLNDAAVVDCKTNPEGFRASLDEAISNKTDLSTQRSGLRIIIKQDLKTALTNMIIK